MSATPDPALLEEAAGWLVRFQSETLSVADRAAFERWRDRSAAHAAAWRRVEDMLRSFGQVPPALGAHTLRRLDRLERPARRQVLRTVTGLLLAGPAAWLAWREVPWREWSADARTAIGERRQMLLADGTRLWLNTATAVDIQYSARQRLVWLRAGEILLTTGKDPAPAPRPFLVQTGLGSVQALGTRFMVRDEGAAIQVAVFEDAVEIRAGCCARVSGPASTRTPSGRTRPRTPRRSRGSTACWPRAIGGWPIWWTNWRATGAAFCVAIPRWPGCGYRARFPWPTPTPACGCSRRRCRCGSSASRRIGSPWRRGRRAARPSLQINRRRADTFSAFVRCTG